MTSLLVIDLSILFIVGFIQEVLGAYYLRLVTEHRLFLATFIHFLYSLVGWIIWFWFMYQFQHATPGGLTGSQAIIYSAGGALGVFFGLRRPQQAVGMNRPPENKT